MLQVNRLGPEIGAEVLGADIRNLDAETFDVIYRTWLDCNVIAVRDQSLELEDFFTYSRRFGNLYAHPSKSTRHPDHPELTVLGVDKFDGDGTLNETIYARGGGELAYRRRL